MTERGQAARRPARVPLPRRSRLRWAAAAGVAVCWLVLLYVSGSLIAATMLLAFLAGLGIAAVLVLRALGISRDHPWVRQLAARPWRDGQEVLQLALRHLPDVFVITPSRSLLAPDVVELRMNPDDLDSLTEWMDLSLIAESMAEVYQEQVAARGARLNGNGLAEARVIPDPSVPPGRYRLAGLPVDAGAQPGFQLAYAGAQPPGAGHPGAQPPGAQHPGAQPPGAEHPGAAPHPAGAYPVVNYAPTEHPGMEYSPAPYPGFVGHDGNTRAQQAPARPAAVGMSTVIELSRSPVPVLRLVTGSSVAETRVSGARAGRGAVELALPDVPTVSREHARFTFSDGQWWIANLGRNGLTLNGAALVGEQPLGTGDSIRWGLRSDALLSRVELG